VVHRRLGQRESAATGGAEEGGFALIALAGGLDIGVQIRFQIMMRRHLMAAAFLMQANPPALALGIVVLDAHGDDRANRCAGLLMNRDHL
jgi:hypothetical protein